LRENSILESIETVPELNDTAGLESLINEIDMALRNISNLERLGDNFSILIPPPELKPAHEIKALATLIDQIEDMEKRVTKGTAYYADVEKAWKEKRRQIEKRLSEIRICPLCRQPIDIEHFLSELVEYPETSMDVKKISRL
jgi:exonuclease SbcC